MLQLPQPQIHTSGLKFLKEGHHTLTIFDPIEARIYSDTRPNNSTTANLQKGLIIVYKGVELVGEGTGFGVPILQYSDETYFSGSSKVYFGTQNGNNIILKEFLMNKISKKKLGSFFIENKKILKIQEYGNKLYQYNRNLRLLLLEKFYQKIGFNTDFIDSIPVGKVVVEYFIGHNNLKILVDFMRIKRDGLKKIFVTNEQGSKFFARYFEPYSSVLYGRHIGAWERVAFDYADITDLEGKIGFRLYQKNNSILFRGRENLKGIFDWIGLDYEIDCKVSFFEYEIDFLGLKT